MARYLEGKKLKRAEDGPQTLIQELVKTAFKVITPKIDLATAEG